MKYSIMIKHSAEKSLIKLDDKTHNRIVSKILQLRETPRPKQSKKLESKEYYRIRCGKHRILYIIDDTIKQIEILLLITERMPIKAYTQLLLNKDD
jgi:mRNA-degrading endonuclease RelE of RelBE toxin-antitoxin system